MLLLSSASCMDDTGRYGQDNRNYRITASIEDANVASRVADKNNRTSFTKNDEIFIGWSGSASYKYLCSGTDNVFVPNASDANRELWTGLLNASSTKEVYAWCPQWGPIFPFRRTRPRIARCCPPFVWRHISRRLPQPIRWILHFTILRHDFLSPWMWWMI